MDIRIRPSPGLPLSLELSLRTPLARQAYRRPLLERHLPLPQAQVSHMLRIMALFTDRRLTSFTPTRYLWSRPQAYNRLLLDLQANRLCAMYWNGTITRQKRKPDLYLITDHEEPNLHSLYTINRWRRH